MNTKHIITIFVALALIAACGTAYAFSEEDEAIRQIRGTANWEAGITSVSHLTQSQKLAMCGAMIEDPPKGARIVSAPPTVGYPESFSWHNIDGNDWMTPVRNQGSCGSCWAFAAVGAVECKINIEENDPTLDVDLSEQHLVASCCSNCGDCGGGYPTAALKYIQRTGIPDEACYPYKARNGACSPCSDYEPYTITKYGFVNNDIDSFKYALQKGPLVVVMRVSEDWFYYKGGIYEPSWTSDKFGWANHAVVLVGWQDVASIDTGGYWIVKNSWGSGWGEDGYGKVKYGDLEQYNYAYSVEKPIIPSAPSKWIKPINATASSCYADHWAASKTIDDNNGTAWFTASADKDRWIKFDLGEVKSIDAVRMLTIYKYYIPITVDIDVSTNGMGWVRVIEGVTIDKYREFAEIPFTQVDARYVRMTQTTVNSRYGTCSEFDVRECEKPDGIVIILKYGDRIERIVAGTNLTSVEIVME